jgi:hypothetical protein
VAQYQNIGRARTGNIVLNEWQKMIARYWIKVTHGSGMTAMAEVRRDEKVRCGKDDRLPSRVDDLFGFEFIYMYMIGPEPQHIPWSILRLGLLLRRFALAYKYRLISPSFVQQLPSDEFPIAVFRVDRRVREHVRCSLRASRVCLLRLSL